MHYLKNLVILISVVIFLLGCNQNRTNVEQAHEDEIQFIVPIGKKISNELLTSLKTELQTALVTGDVENAIGICNIKALKITDSIAANSSIKVDIKRTTDKPRNILNAPDQYEQKALEYYNTIVQSGNNFPEYYVQKIENEDKLSYNFYKPLIMDNVCLLCHGDESSMNNDLKEHLQKLYPEDKALGYKTGDFRGLVRITFYEPEL